MHETMARIDDRTRVVHVSEALVEQLFDGGDDRLAGTGVLELPGVGPRLRAARRAARAPASAVRIVAGGRIARGWFGAGGLILVVPRRGDESDLICTAADQFAAVAARLLGVLPRDAPPADAEPGAVRSRWLVGVGPAANGPDRRRRVLEVLDAESGLWEVRDSPGAVACLVPLSSERLWRLLTELPLP